MNPFLLCLQLRNRMYVNHGTNLKHPWLETEECTLNCILSVRLGELISAFSEPLGFEFKTTTHYKVSINYLIPCLIGYLISILSEMDYYHLHTSNSLSVCSTQHLTFWCEIPSKYNKTKLGLQPLLRVKRHGFWSGLAKSRRSALRGLQNFFYCPTYLVAT
jgi:hypothetical protein